MKEYLFLAGQIRALESKLLTPAQIERMVGASNVDAAFRVFTELQYAQYLDREIRAEEFGVIIDKGLQETKNIIVEGTDDALEFQFIWKEFDLNNIKRALKERIVENKEAIDDFSEGNGYSLLGSISQEDLTTVIFNAESAELFPSEYLAVINDTQDIYESTGNFKAIEFALDKAHFDLLGKLAKNCKSSFLVKYTTLKADLSNMKSVIRLLASEQELSADFFVNSGKIAVNELMNISNRDELSTLLDKYEYFQLATSLRKCTKEHEVIEEFILHFERIVAVYYENFLIEAESGVLGSVEIPMVYFMKRVKNARTLKFIMFSKMYGLAPERIYQTLKHL